MKETPFIDVVGIAVRQGTAGPGAALQHIIRIHYLKVFFNPFWSNPALQTIERL
ncbi:MAG TPA: hypothetical protein H9724_00935 [Candidatus Gemmiger avistercoris]|uniref:Uncharacterized protein n=2 Tax=Eubacteriales TaxID=186802 RepID=A0A9D2FIJ7_9FIRM|nr:hypothetical protein [Candidatus Gemmiger avistercoris]